MRNNSFERAPFPSSSFMRFSSVLETVLFLSYTNLPWFLSLATRDPTNILHEENIMHITKY